ncbi:MAG: hypothetical protein KZQ92_22075 [Candidatus Thiodiazotropha sp. (ex Lucinoma borealis)]|nr:hypothetical protein [Candidatus Thiodiazotropha sp. (ex Lucinoma borealis)]
MLRIVLLSTLIIFNVSCYADSKIDEKVKELNKQSHVLLGVSIYAVAELIKLKNTPSFIPLNLIKGNGEIERYKELERKGYVTSKIMKGLPNGSMSEEEFLWVVRTDEGAEIVKYFKE